MGLTARDWLNTGREQSSGSHPALAVSGGGRRPRSAGRGRRAPAASGFTLIEVVIVVAIIAVLVGLAIPSYQEFMTKSRRTEAKELLYTAAQRQQQVFTWQNRYTTNISGELIVASISANGYYALSVAAGNTGSINTSYSMSATPVAGTTQAEDTDCGTYTLNSLGQKTVSGSQTTPPCW